MSDTPLSFRTPPHERPGDDDAREARHQVLATLLGAYADGELPPETVAQIDAHLLGCARCRREVSLHTALHERLQREPMETASAALRDRIAAQITALPPLRTEPMPVATSTQPWWQSRIVHIGTAVAVTLLAGAALVRDQLPLPEGRATSVALNSVPLLQHVLQDYRDVISRDLPGRARDLDAVRGAVPFPVQPLRGEGLRLLAAWSTDLHGEPAAVLAYRWRDQLVLEYLVAEPVFFRHPLVRAPIAAGEAVSTVSGAQGVLAWAAPESGAILVGEVSPALLMALRAGGAGR